MEDRETQPGDLIELAPGGLALRQSDMVHIVSEPSIAPLVGAGEAWIGLTNLSGNLIPVADLGILETGHRSGGRTMIGISTNGVTFGLVCDGVSRTFPSPPPDALTDEPEPGDPSWLLPAPPGEPRVIDPAMLLEDPKLGPVG